MIDGKIYTAIGLMSGTSMDGIDAAILKTDGERFIEFGPALTVPYEDVFKSKLRRVLGPVGRAAPGITNIERYLTILHADAVGALLKQAELDVEDIDLVGFHGHTIHHNPGAGITVQLGESQLLADWLGIPVVGDFRARDIAAGGEGAPLAPVFHAALARANPKIQLPCAVLNIGGVSNVTWIGEGEDEILAFDTGPGNAPLNDWVRAHDGGDMDVDGALAAKGQPNNDVLNAMMAHDYFDRKPPKSLDRQEFSNDCVADLNVEDGAATLSALTAHAAARAVEHFPQPPKLWVVTGGGCHNPEIMKYLRSLLDTPVHAADAVGWDSDAMEAQAFAYLATRAERWLPITFPTTTRAPGPLSGGTEFHPT